MLPTAAEMLDARWQALQAEAELGIQYRSYPAELRDLTARSPELVELNNYSTRQYQIVMARKRLHRLRDFVAAKFQGDILHEYPGEREVYIRERQKLLDDLQVAGLDDGLRWATEAIPERLAELIAGKRTWDHDGSVRLDDELYRLVVKENLGRLEELFTKHVFALDGVDRIIREIHKSTRGKNDLERARALAIAEDERNQHLLRQWKWQPSSLQEQLVEAEPADEAVEPTEPESAESKRGPKPRDNGWYEAKKREILDKIVDDYYDSLEWHTYSTFVARLGVRGTSQKNWQHLSKKMEAALGMSISVATLVAEAQAEVEADRSRPAQSPHIIRREIPTTG